MSVVRRSDVMEILAFAATGLTDIFTNVPEEDLDNTTVVINAGKIADCLELLLMYAECYEDLSVDELTESSLLDRSIGVITTAAVHSLRDK